MAPAAGAPSWAAPVSSPCGVGPESILRAARPDYRAYIGDLRPFPSSGMQGIYMALVRQGAVDPAARESAPFFGPGVRNDILYSREAIAGGRSAAWSLLLLDHEYFHARHLAGTTSLPLPGSVPPEVERHFYEAAAWGFNVGEARAGRYPGLRPDEFREALDRYGEHFAALRALVRAQGPASRGVVPDLLLQPPTLFRMGGSPPAGAPGHLSARGPEPATP